MIMLSDHIYLRELTLADHPELWQLMLGIYPPAYGHYWEDHGNWYLHQQYGLENFAFELSQSQSRYYFILSKEDRTDSVSIIGIFKYDSHSRYQPLPEYRGFKIHRLYLDPKAQGKAIGKLIMNYAQTIAENSHHELLWLDAMDTHTQAQSFYRKLGFTKAYARELPYDLMHDEHRKIWYLHKKL